MRNRSKTIYLVLTLIALCWLGLVFAAPWLMSRGYAFASILIYEGFAAICHQKPDRSFQFHGFTLGVCSRCTGIYAGFALGMLLYPLIRDLKDVTFPERKWLILAAIPLTIDFAGGLLGIFNNTPFSRAATGGLAGLAAAFYITPGFISALRFYRRGTNNEMNA